MWVLTMSTERRRRASMAKVVDPFLAVISGPNFGPNAAFMLRDEEVDSLKKNLRGFPNIFINQPSWATSSFDRAFHLL
jgi:hypothetical protein